MGVRWYDTYFQFQKELEANCTSIPPSVLYFMENSLYFTELQNKYGKPMILIGIYIAMASLFCILPMVADLLHGLKSKQLWFPCKYFTLNAASLTVIAVAMKLPMDLNNLMPSLVDEATKLGSMSFMCIIMANLLPSLATMDSKELLTNIIALGILVITLVVNVYIQIETGVVTGYVGGHTYAVMLIVLLMIHICSALMSIKSKQILESKYKAGHETALKDLELPQPTIEKLKQHVSYHWIMARTGSPQFIMVCYATTSASGVICVLITLIHVYMMIYVKPYMMLYGSDYKWSMIAILITQFTGVILGAVAPISRCFASLSFKVSIKWIWNHIKVFKVESYCTQKLSEWKQSPVPFKCNSRVCKIVIHDLKVLILTLCIGIQKTVVVACKMIALIPIFIEIGIFCCFQCLKWLKVKTPIQLQHNKDLSRYVLQLQDDIELAEKTLTSISKSMNHLIQKAEKQQPYNLMRLLEEFSGFEGVGKYEAPQVPPLTEEKYVDCWNLPVVTLTTIAMSLPNIPKNKVDGLLRSVSEGLAYATLVEETLNTTDEYVSIQKTARTLWLEVEVYHKWLGIKLPNPAHHVSNAKDTVQWFNDKAIAMAKKTEGNHTKGSDESSLYMSVSANSMYRITQTILASYQASIHQVSQEELFVQLSSMISHILAACLTNLPRVIAMKCGTSVIEKREASVHTAAQLLGETMQIISGLQDRQLPSLNPDELPFIDKWRDCFLHPSP